MEHYSTAEPTTDSRDPFVLYAINHHFAGPSLGAYRELLLLFSDGSERGFAELLQSTGQSEANLAKKLRQLVQLTEKYFDIYGFKITRDLTQKKASYKLEPLPNRSAIPPERKRKIFSLEYNGPAQESIEPQREKIHQRARTALEDFDVIGVHFLPRPDEEIEQRLRNASWFLTDSVASASVQALVEAAQEGNALNVNALQIKLDLPNKDNGFRNYERDTMSHAAELGFIIVFVRKAYYALLQLDNASRRKNLGRRYSDETLRDSTFLDLVMPFERRILLARLKASEGELDDIQKKLVLAVARAQLSGIALDTAQALDAINLKSRHALQNRVKRSKHERYKTGFFVRYRTDERLEVCLLDDSEEVSPFIKPIGILANY